MGQRKRIPGLPAELSEIAGRVPKKVSYYLHNEVHVIEFVFGDIAPEEKYLLWGTGCCCDVAYVDSIEGDISSLSGRQLIAVMKDGGDYHFETKAGEVIVHWGAKHPGYEKTGVKFVKSVKLEARP